MTDIATTDAEAVLAAARAEAAEIVADARAQKVAAVKIVGLAEQTLLDAQKVARMIVARAEERNYG